RKLRLLACGVSRMLLSQRDVTEGLAEVIELAERFADGARVKTKMAQAWLQAWNVANLRGFDSATGAVEDGALRRRRAKKIPLVHCVFGNPFHTRSARARQTPEIVSLAQAAYDERIDSTGHLDVHRLAVLADALEEAGCTEEAILDHLRAPGPHIRGCRVLDL